MDAYKEVSSGMASTPPYILAYDIEGTGQFLGSCGIVAIGATLHDPHTGLVVQDPLTGKYICVELHLRTDGVEWEEACRREFWDRRPELLAKLSEGAIHPQEAMRELALFHEWVMLVTQGHVQVVSDNPAYDVGFLNWYITTYTPGKPSLHYITGSYRGVRCVNSMLSMLPFRAREGLRGRCPFVADHTPMHDAQKVGWMYAMLCERKRPPANFNR